jgi:hypothetical protein
VGEEVENAAENSAGSPTAQCGNGAEGLKKRRNPAVGQGIVSIHIVSGQSSSPALEPIRQQSGLERPHPQRQDRRTKAGSTGP